MQHIIRHGTADDGRSIRRSTRLEIHSPTPIGATSNRRRKHSQPHMRHSRLRRDSNAGFGIELQAIARECAKDIALARCMRPGGSDGRVVKPVAAVRYTRDARRLNLQFIQRPRPLYSRARFFSPSVCDTHRLNLIQRRLRRGPSFSFYARVECRPRGCSANNGWISAARRTTAKTCRHLPENQCVCCLS